VFSVPLNYVSFGLSRRNVYVSSSQSATGISVGEVVGKLEGAGIPGDNWAGINVRSVCAFMSTPVVRGGSLASD
jgi:hypothetical protein